MRTHACSLAFAIASVTSVPVAAFEPAEIDAAIAVARDVEADVRRLAADDLDGRGSAEPGGAAAQEILIDELIQIGAGLDAEATGRDAYRQTFDTARSNLLAVVRGAENPDEFVLVGAHYDHFPAGDCYAPDDDEICNGATDNATGTAVALAIGRALLALPTPPSRSVIIALWDGEERGLLGSKYFTAHPMVPLADIVTNVNFDIQGANLSPSVRGLTFAVGSESGGELLRTMMLDAAVAAGLDVRPLTVTFGQGRSDYHPFWGQGVPVTFFSDATNACYHTTGDEVEIVDFGKLARQAEVGLRLVLSLTESEERPTFVPLAALDTYEDLLDLSDLMTRTLADLPHVFPGYQETLLYYEELARTRVAAGPEAFQPTDALTIAQGAIDIAESGFPCDPALLPEPDRAPLGALAALVAAARYRARRRRSRASAAPTAAS